jgi:predicted dehydrogenase
MSFLSTRRNFLKASALVGAAASKPGMTQALSTNPHAHVGHLSCAPLETVNVGIIGLGMRGPGAVSRLSAIPGVRVTALSDIYEARVNKQVEWLTSHNFAAPKRYFGTTETWKNLVTDPNVNLVYIATPWQMHVEMVLFAMECGKHVACEVPMVFTVNDC